MQRNPLTFRRGSLRPGRIPSNVISQQMALQLCPGIAGLIETQFNFHLGQGLITVS